jgi:hypothetical protein
LPLGVLFVAAGLASAAQPAVSFLSASKYTVTLGESLTLRFDVGAAKDAQPVPWPSGEVSWLFVRAGPTQENRHDVRPERAQDNCISLKIEQPGVTLIGADQRPIRHEVTAAELRAFLSRNAARDQGGQVDGLGPDAKLRVRQVTSAKALIRVQDQSGRVLPSAVATSKTGQAVEIRPHFDPTAARVGSDIAVTVYVDGDKRTGAKVQATSVATGKTEAFVTDASGSGHFRVTDPGLWRVEAHYAQPPAGEPSADWVIYSATLTFEATEGAGR